MSKTDVTPLQEAFDEITLLDPIQSVYSALGILECRGVDHISHLPVFQTVLEHHKDFGGTTVCDLSCNGTCFFYKSLSLTKPPISLYPWGCKCAGDRCDENGPKAVTIQ